MKSHVTSPFDFHMQGVQNIYANPDCSSPKNKGIGETRLNKKKEREIDKENYMN